MNIRYKKVIAREVLVLFMTSLILLLLLGAFFIAQNINEKHNSNLYEKKQKYFKVKEIKSIILDFTAMYDSTHNKSTSQNSSSIKEEKIDLTQYGYDPYPIDSTRFNERYVEYSNQFYSEKEKKRIDKILSNTPSIRKTELIDDYFPLGLIIILSISYPLRFIIYALRWSIRILKT